jgi:hypothetical protein
MCRGIEVLDQCDMIERDQSSSYRNGLGHGISFVSGDAAALRDCSSLQQSVFFVQTNFLKDTGRRAALNILHAAPGEPAQKRKQENGESRLVIARRQQLRRIR